MTTAGSHGDSLHQEVLFKRICSIVTNETRNQSYGSVIIVMRCLSEIGRGSYITSNDILIG